MTATFPLSIDWANGVKIAREFKTAVITSRSGKEQRRAARNRPRKKVEISVTSFGGDARAMQRFAFVNAGIDFTIPDFVLGGPNLTGRLAPNAQVSMLSDNVLQSTFTFAVNPLSEPDVAPPAADTIFNSREVFLIKPNWVTAPNVTFSNQFETIDYGQGAIAQFTPVTYTTRAQSANYLRLNVADAQSIEETFERAKGQRGEFYMPTWHNDLPPIVNSVIGATNFTVAGSDDFIAYATSTVMKAVCICYNDGTYQFAQVSSITLQAGNSVIGLGAPLTRAIDANVTQICWMPVHRFATDLLTTEWITNTVAQFQLAVMTLEDLNPEVEPAL